MVGETDDGRLTAFRKDKGRRSTGLWIEQKESLGPLPLGCAEAGDDRRRVPLPAATSLHRSFPASKAREGNPDFPSPKAKPQRENFLY